MRNGTSNRRRFDIDLMYHFSLDFKAYLSDEQNFLSLIKKILTIYNLFLKNIENY